MSNPRETLDKVLARVHSTSEQEDPQAQKPKPKSKPLDIAKELLKSKEEDMKYKSYKDMLLHILKPYDIKEIKVRKRKDETYFDLIFEMPGDKEKDKEKILVIPLAVTPKTKPPYVTIRHKKEVFQAPIKGTPVMKGAMPNPEVAPIKFIFNLVGRLLNPDKEFK